MKAAGRARVAATGGERAAAEEEDGGALVNICVRTGGAGGSDASAMFARDPGILGERYALPYLRLEPELCAVAVESETGYVVGYAVATLDTGEFCARIQVDYLPGVRDRYPDPHRKPRAAWTAEDLVARDLHDPLCGRYVACVFKFSLPIR